MKRAAQRMRSRDQTQKLTLMTVLQVPTRISILNSTKTIRFKQWNGLTAKQCAILCEKSIRKQQECMQTFVARNTHEPQVSMTPKPDLTNHKKIKYYLTSGTSLKEVGTAQTALASLPSHSTHGLPLLIHQTDNSMNWGSWPLCLACWLIILPMLAITLIFAEDDDALDMDALSASINVVAPPAPAPVAESPAPAPAPKPKAVEPISVKKDASSSSAVATGASPLAPAAANKPAESPAASPMVVASPAPLTATPADKLSIQKRRQRDIEDRSNSALAADLLGDVVVSEGPTTAELCAAVKASNLARPETVDALAAAVAARLVALKVW